MTYLLFYGENLKSQRQQLSLVSKQLQIVPFLRQLSMSWQRVVYNEPLQVKLKKSNDFQLILVKVTLHLTSFL